MRGLLALGAGAGMASCLTAPPAAPTGGGDGGGPGGGDAPGAECPFAIGFDAPGDLAGWAMPTPPVGCSCGVEDGALRFRNEGAACTCLVEDPSTLHDLAERTVAIDLVERGASGLSASLTIVFASGRAIFFSSARGDVDFGECDPAGMCTAGLHGGRSHDASTGRWRFALVGEELEFQLSSDGAAWSRAAGTALAPDDGTAAWIQIGSFEPEGVAEQVAFDDLRVCPR